MLQQGFCDSTQPISLSFRFIHRIPPTKPLQVPNTFPSIPSIQFTSAGKQPKCAKVGPIVVQHSIELLFGAPPIGPVRPQCAAHFASLFAFITGARAKTPQIPSSARTVIAGAHSPFVYNYEGRDHNRADNSQSQPTAAGHNHNCLAHFARSAHSPPGITFRH